MTVRVASPQIANRNSKTSLFLAGCADFVRLGRSCFLKVRRDSLWGIWSEEKEELVVPFELVSIRWIRGDLYEVISTNALRGLFSIESGTLVLAIRYSFISRTKNPQVILVCRPHEQPQKFSVWKKKFI